jgi:hypothetical protein
VPRTITDAQVEEVVVHTLEEVPEGATHWSKRELARRVGISPSSVLRIWRAFGLQPPLGLAGHHVHLVVRQVAGDNGGKRRDVQQGGVRGVGLADPDDPQLVAFQVDRVAGQELRHHLVRPRGDLAGEQRLPVPGEGGSLTRVRTRQDPEGRQRVTAGHLSFQAGSYTAPMVLCLQVPSPGGSKVGCLRRAR